MRVYVNMCSISSLWIYTHALCKLRHTNVFNHTICPSEAINETTSCILMLGDIGDVYEMIDE